MAPVDEVLLWSAPWAGPARRRRGGPSRSLARKARALAARPPDVAIDLQGDVRAAFLMRLTGARARVGYANTGGGSWLTHVVPLDETVSWVEQNRRAVEVVAGPAARDRDAGARRRRSRLRRGRSSSARGSPAGGRWSASTPAAGAPIKQWPVERWREVARRLQEELGATVVVTGGAGDAALARALGEGLPRPVDRPRGPAVGGGDDGGDRRPGPVPLPGHRPHAHGLRDGHAVGGGLRAFGGGALFLRATCRRSPRATWWCAASCGARPATSSAGRPRSAWPTSRRSACGS